MSGGHSVDQIPNVSLFTDTDPKALALPLTEENFRVAMLANVFCKFRYRTAIWFTTCTSSHALPLLPLHPRWESPNKSDA